MTAGRLVGIDVGTGGVRASLFDPSGALVASASVPCAHDSPERGWAEIGAERWVRATEGALEELARQTPSKNGTALADVTGIGVVGQAPTAVPVDETGAPTTPAILWLDTRAIREAEELGVQAYYLGPKLMWLARRHPNAIARARWIMQSHAYVAYGLTGEAATDPSTAALSLPLFDLATRAWVPSACERIGVRAEQLPPIRAAHEILGGVTARAARAVGHGLRPGTPVVVGGGDFAASTLGAGVIDEGEACLMLGTAGNLLVPRNTPGRDPRLINAYHVGADRWLSLGGTLAGGAQEWLRHALARASTSEDTAVRHALPPFDTLEAEGEAVAPGSEGVLFLPYLQGERTPIWDPTARGAYVGLALHHGRGHLWRALLEGIALSFADCQDVVAADGVRFEAVVAANGGGRSHLFRQILCDALGVPLSYAPDAGGTVAGAAILAGLGTGALQGPTDARSWRTATVRHEPDLSVHQRYRELLALRRQAYDGLRPIFAGLAKT
jgi:xylulokinase